MKLKRKGFHSFLVAALSTTLFLLLRYAKVSAIFGSSFSSFSLFDVFMPLSGVGGFGCIGLLVAARFGVRALLLDAPISALAYHIPGVCAATSWIKKYELINLILPLLCMVAFLAHPVGFSAAPYCLYWLIPVALFFVKEKTIFMRSLTSTFVAHSVGSVLWLYTKSIAATTWLALIPVVAVERLTFALAMTMVYCVALEAKKVIARKGARLFSTRFTHD